MPTPSLLEPDDLTGFAGAPFADAVVAAVAADVRAQAEWHIAPSVTETLIVESYGGRHLMLPTLHLTAVTAVREVALDGTTTVVTGYRTVATPRFRAGILERPAGWLQGGEYEVDVTHGHETCPPDLLPAIAFRCQRARIDASTGSVRLGGLSVTPAGVPNTSVAEAAQPDAAVARYKIPPRP